MRLQSSELQASWRYERRRERVALGIAAAVALAVCAVCLGVKFQHYEEPGLFWPHYAALFDWLASAVLAFGGDQSAAQHVAELTADPVFSSATGRMSVTAMAFVAGAGIAIASGMFQTVYRNPLASANTIGAMTGVQFGNVLFVMIFSTAAAGMVIQRYEFCYALSVLCVLVVLGIGWLAGDRRGNPSVLVMVMAGAVVTQGAATLTMYFMYTMPDEDMLVYQEFGMGTNLQTDAQSLALFFTLELAALLPMLLLRYRLNATGLDADEARAAGVRPGPYRVLAQVCAVVMVTASMVHCGQAGMLSTVVPYVVRGFVGADTRRVIAFSALSGGTLMVLCRTIATATPLFSTTGQLLFDAAGNVITLPVVFIVNILLLPAFIVILARQKETFE